MKVPETPLELVHRLEAGETLTSANSGSTWFETCPRLTGLLLIIVSLLVAVAAGCSDGQVPADSSPQHATPLAGGGQSSSVVFPQHDAPLGTDRGGEYFAGQLVLIEGCLRVEVPDKDAADPWPPRLLIWPSSFTLREESGTVRIVDGLGRTAARVGDFIRLSRADVTYQQAKDLMSEAALSVDCAGPFFLVGDEVTVFDPKNEATELRLSDPDVLFFRQETVISVNRVFLDAAGVGELVLDGPCLRLKGSATIIWPAGFTPHVEGGVVHVRNGAGWTIAKVGDEIAGGGGYYKSGHGECPGEVFRIYDIKIQPDVEVYFPKQDAFLETRRKYMRIIGELVLDGKCLVVDNAIRVRDGSDILGTVLLLWPSAFKLNVEDGAVEIIDATGNAVARVGDEVQFSAFGVPYNWALEHGGLEEMTPACGVPYWAVGEDFAATETP